ncbi:MAG: flagellar hook assembly protein FlgD [Pseudomonadota bacterium]
MSDTNGINAATFQQFGIEQKAKPAADSNELGQQQFFDLMITQLQNQDPFKPMESGEFLGQIAQFSTVNGITELQQSFESMANSLQSNLALQASTMVGREVLIPRDEIIVDSGIATKTFTELPDNAGQVVLDIYDQFGQLVRKVEMGPQSSGPLTYQWDGLDSEGRTLPDGRYRVAIQAELSGASVALQAGLRTKVESVTLAPGGSGTILNVAQLGAIDVSEVGQIF